jgi:hypothetical protein
MPTMFAGDRNRFGRWAEVAKMAIVIMSQGIPMTWGCRTGKPHCTGPMLAEDERTVGLGDFPCNRRESAGWPMKFTRISFAIPFRFPV